jgi:hydroxyacylglutathione hydrolase
VAKIDQYLAHRRAREGQVASALTEDPKTVNDLVAAIYADITEALHPVARYSVWAHLRRLAAEGMAHTTDLDDLDAAWVAAAT